VVGCLPVGAVWPEGYSTEPPEAAFGRAGIRPDSPFAARWSASLSPYGVHPKRRGASSAVTEPPGNGTGVDTDGNQFGG
jgi:hypothetical protein